VKMDGCHLRDGPPVCLGKKVATPLVWEEWDRELQHHPDQRFRSYIVQGIRYGFRLGYQYGFQCKPAKTNSRLALQYPQVMGYYLARQCRPGGWTTEGRRMESGYD